MNIVMLYVHYYMFSLLCKSLRDTNSSVTYGVSLSPPIKYNNNVHEPDNYVPFICNNTSAIISINNYASLLLFVHIADELS